MSRDDIKQILKEYKTVAVVGLSREVGKDSHRVSAYLKAHGFHIIPVNPFADEVLGEKSYKRLLDIPPEIQKTVEIIDVFRPSEDVPPIAEQAVKLQASYGNPHVMWMQLGIVNEKDAKAAKKSGLTVIINKCIMVEHRRLF